MLHLFRHVVLECDTISLLRIVIHRTECDFSSFSACLKSSRCSIYFRLKSIMMQKHSSKSHAFVNMKSIVSLIVLALIISTKFIKHMAYDPPPPPPTDTHSHIIRASTQGVHNAHSPSLEPPYFGGGGGNIPPISGIGYHWQPLSRAFSAGNLPKTTTNKNTLSPRKMRTRMRPPRAFEGNGGGGGGDP